MMKGASLFTIAVAAAIASLPAVSLGEGVSGQTENSASELQSHDSGRGLVGAWICFRTTDLPLGAATGFVNIFHADGTFIAHGDVNSATVLTGVYRQDGPNHFLTLGKSFIFNPANPNGVAESLRISRGNVTFTSANALTIKLAFTHTDFSNNVLDTSAADFSCTRDVIDFKAQ